MPPDPLQICASAVSNSFSEFQAHVAVEQLVSDLRGRPAGHDVTHRTQRMRGHAVPGIVKRPCGELLGLRPRHVHQSLLQLQCNSRGADLG